MLRDSRDPAYYDRFASLRSYLGADPRTTGLPENEIDCLERAFAMHEVGTVPAPYAQALHRLRETHRLGVVSNIFCKSGLYLLEFDRADVLGLFDVVVFSSDHGHIKPSAYIFETALKAFSADRSKVVFVGDSLKRDVAGAGAVGLSTVWINAMNAAPEPGSPGPDLVIRDLRDLLESPGPFNAETQRGKEKD